MQQILFFRELNFSLQEIKTIINDPNFNLKNTLSMQRNLLDLKKQRLENMVNFIDELLTTGEKNMSNKLTHAMNNDAFNNKKLVYAKEAKDKWGESNSYKQSQRRMANYSKEDITRINLKQENTYQQLAKLMPLGAENKKVQALIHDARMLINDHWYDCNKQQFVALAKIYVTDISFKENIDKHGKGLAEFINQASLITLSA